MLTKTRLIIFILLLAFTLAFAVPVFAADEQPTTEETTSETESEQPLGAGLLILIVGISSVAAVGLAMISRDNAPEDLTASNSPY